MNAPSYYYYYTMTSTYYYAPYVLLYVTLPTTTDHTPVPPTYLPTYLQLPTTMTNHQPTMMMTSPYLTPPCLNLSHLTSSPSTSATLMPTSVTYQSLYPHLTLCARRHLVTYATYATPTYAYDDVTLSPYAATYAYVPTYAYDDDERRHQSTYVNQGKNCPWSMQVPTCQGCRFPWMQVKGGYSCCRGCARSMPAASFLAETERPLSPA